MTAHPRRVVWTTFGPLETDGTAGAPIHPVQPTDDDQEDTDHGHEDQHEDAGAGS